MKKITFFSLFIFAALALFTACKGQPQLRNVRGIVKHYVVTNDTVISASLLDSIPDMVVGINETDTLVFSMNDARIQNGPSFPGDSVIIDYIEGNDVLRALVVTRIPSTVNIVDGDSIKHAIDLKK